MAPRAASKAHELSVTSLVCLQEATRALSASADGKVVLTSTAARGLPRALKLFLLLLVLLLIIIPALLLHARLVPLEDGI